MSVYGSEGYHNCPKKVGEDEQVGKDENVSGYEAQKL